MMDAHNRALSLSEKTRTESGLIKPLNALSRVAATIILMLSAVIYVPVGVNGDGASS
jgi:hypothetical protein